MDCPARVVGAVQVEADRTARRRQVRAVARRLQPQAVRATAPRRRPVDAAARRMLRRSAAAGAVP
jgi:hypothetical protein